jgi:hypothetical protein
MGAAACIAAVCVLSVLVSGWLIDGVESINDGRRTASERSTMGDYFGGVSAVFSGLALLLLVATIIVQQRELRLQRRELALQRDELVASRNELRRSAEADLRAMQMDNPILAEVWNDYPGAPPDALRQNLFANLTFSHFLLAYRWGGITEAEMLVHARHLIRSPVFHRYWLAARDLKAALPAESDEGMLFRIFDQAMREAHHGDPQGAT